MITRANNPGTRPSSSTPPHHKAQSKTARTATTRTTRTKRSRQPPPTAITIIELKYCRASAPTQQLHKATSQHIKLQQDLATAYNCPVNIQPILLGVSGAIYQHHTRTAIEALGVERGQLKRTLSRLHLHAVHSLRSIVSTRRHKDRKQTHTQAPPHTSSTRRRHNITGPPNSRQPPHNNDHG